MRYWSRVSNPDARKSHTRSTLREQTGLSQFGQRPMFSRPDEENEPATGKLAPEARLDDVVPTDESTGSEKRTPLVVPEGRIASVVLVSKNNVSNPPTDAQLTTAFGYRQVGFMGIVIDAAGAGLVWIVVKSTSNLWWYELLTKAT